MKHHQTIKQALKKAMTMRDLNTTQCVPYVIQGNKPRWMVDWSTGTSLLGGQEVGREGGRWDGMEEREGGGRRRKGREDGMVKGSEGRMSKGGREGGGGGGERRVGEEDGGEREGGRRRKGREDGMEKGREGREGGGGLEKGMGEGGRERGEGGKGEESEKKSGWMPEGGRSGMCGGGGGDLLRLHWWSVGERDRMCGQVSDDHTFLVPCVCSCRCMWSTRFKTLVPPIITTS